MKIDLDPWQQDVLNTNCNLHIRAGRQVGKSFIVSRKAVEYAVANPRKTVMIIAFTEMAE